MYFNIKAMTNPLSGIKSPYYQQKEFKNPKEMNNPQV